MTDMKPTAEQNRRRLHGQLAQLHEELSGARSIEPADRELVRQLGEDINALLSPESEASSGGYQSVTARLREVVRRFEAAHPQLSRTMERTIDQLSLLNL